MSFDVILYKLVIAATLLFILIEAIRIERRAQFLERCRRLGEAEKCEIIYEDEH